MKMLDRTLAYLAQSAAPNLDILAAKKNQTPPPVSRNTRRTKGRKFASQNERANRRKARAKR